MSDDLTHISFELGGDTGTNDAASIEPLGLEPALPEAFNRAPEHLRERTERLRADLNKLIWLMRRLPWRVYSESSASLAEVSWPGAYDGVDPALGLFTLSNNIIIEGLVGPGEGRGGGGATDPDMGGAVHASVRAMLTWTVGADTVKLYAIKGREGGSSWLSLEVVVGTAVTATPTVTLGGTAPAPADVGFQPGLDRILVTLSSDLTNDMQSVVDAINAHPVVSSLVTADLDAGPGTEIATALSRTEFDRGLNAVRMRLTGAELAAFFAATTENLMYEGDTLGVYFADINSLLGRRTEVGISLTASQLVNLTREPDKAERTIPIARVLDNRLHFVHGVVVEKLNAGASTEFIVDGGHARTQRTAQYLGTALITNENTVGAQLSALWAALEGVYLGTAAMEYLAVNVDVGDMPISGLSDRARIESTADVQMRWRRRTATAGTGDRIARLLFDEEAGLGVRTQVDVERDSGDSTSMRFYVHDSSSLQEVMSLGPTTYFNLRGASTPSAAAVDNAPVVACTTGGAASIETALAIRKLSVGGVAAVGCGVGMVFAGSVPDGVGGNETGFLGGVYGRLTTVGTGGGTHSASVGIRTQPASGVLRENAWFGDIGGPATGPLVAFGPDLAAAGMIGPHLGVVASGLYGLSTSLKGVALEIGNHDAADDDRRATAISFTGKTNDGANTEYELVRLQVAAPTGVGAGVKKGRLRIEVNDGTDTTAGGSSYYQEFDENARHWTNTAAGRIRQDIAAVAKITVSATVAAAHPNTNGLNLTRGVTSVNRTGVAGVFEIQIAAGLVPDINYIVRVSSVVGGLVDFSYDYVQNSATQFTLYIAQAGVLGWVPNTLMVEVWHPGW